MVEGESSDRVEGGGEDADGSRVVIIEAWAKNLCAGAIK